MRPSSRAGRHRVASSDARPSRRPVPGRSRRHVTGREAAPTAARARARRRRPGGGTPATCLPTPPRPARSSHPEGPRAERRPPPPERRPRARRPRRRRAPRSRPERARRTAHGAARPHPRPRAPRPAEGSPATLQRECRTRDPRPVLKLADQGDFACVAADRKMRAEPRPQLAHHLLHGDRILVAAERAVGHRCVIGVAVRRVRRERGSGRRDELAGTAGRARVRAMPRRGTPRPRPARMQTREAGRKRCGVPRPCPRRSRPAVRTGTGSSGAAGIPRSTASRR